MSLSDLHCDQTNYEQEASVLTAALSRPVICGKLMLNATLTLAFCYYKLHSL